jgi:5-formyltetrahydrofolate cyclo-ligase
MRTLLALLALSSPAALACPTIATGTPAQLSFDTAQVVLVPALAVDRRGVRLGRGGGFYDRSLMLCGPGARLVAVVRDSEVLDEVPGEAHDVPMTHALTPGAGLLALGNAGCADSGSST